MLPTTLSEIERCRYALDSLSSSASDHHVEKVASDVYIIRPKVLLGSRLSGLEKANKSVALSFGSLVHGNEWGSLWVINLLLDKIMSKNIELNFPIGLFLGHPDAAIKDERFLECDLNRSFPGDIPLERSLLLEEKRAREIAPLLEQTLFFIDFHQTIQQTLSGFFIFGYQKASFQFARAIMPNLPIVTHWGSGFSKNGRCSDEYVNACGGLGITVEIGAIRQYYDPLQAELGFQCAQGALELVSNFLNTQQDSFVSYLEKKHTLLANTKVNQGPLYTWSHIEPWPIGKHVEIVPGLVNFCDIKKDQIFAYIDGKPLIAPLSGKVLFPKYLSRSTQQMLEKSGQLPKEMIRILKPLTDKDLQTQAN